MKYIIITLIFAGVFWFAYWLGRQARPDEIAERHIATQQKALDRIPTFKEIQHKVGAEPDGIIGPDTIAKWDKAICNQEAVNSINRMEKE